MYQSRIFLEIRLMLPSNTKAFCSCRPGGVAGNCPFCRGERGAAPEVNFSAVEFAYTLADELDCGLLSVSPFEKQKNMLPVPMKYRLSGVSLKIAENGFMEIQFHRRKKLVKITEIRIEEYAGCLVSPPSAAGKDKNAVTGSGSFVMDYSRTGCPCIRIRTEADFETGDEIEVFISELSRRIQYIGFLPVLKPSGADPARQTVRFNAYVGTAEYPGKPSDFVKLRNLDLFEFVKKAVDIEIRRQEEILASGGRISPESFVWNPEKECMEFYKTHSSGFELTVETIPFPTKVPFRCPPALISGLKASVSEHPSERRERFINSYGLPWRLADYICGEKNRADFLDQTAALGVDPLYAARLMMSDIVPLLDKRGLDIRNSPVSPKRFASVIGLRRSREISSKNMKLLLSEVVDTDRDPEILVDEKGWRQLCDIKALSLVAEKVLEENPGYVEKLRSGDISVLEFLTGQVGETAGGSVDCDLTKRILKDKLGISVCSVLSMGGTISGTFLENSSGSSSPGGEISAGGADIISAIAREAEIGNKVVVENVLADNLMSEEIQPSDWAELISSVSSKIAGGNSNGIVITHGTDTLAFTAPLIYWLFADSPVPIVLTASSAPPVYVQEKNGGEDTGVYSGEAVDNLRFALKLAREKKNGVYVVFGGKVLSPVNLKFTSPSPSGFANWNMAEPVFRGQGLLSDYGNADSYVMGRVLSDAADRMHLCRIFPGLRSDRLNALVEAGVTDFFLEVYGRGTGSMKDSSYSLKDLLVKGKQKGCRFYCTSQQECEVNFSGYMTSRRLWREGLIPMGGMTTETAVALYFAASLACDSPEELLLTMETAAACI